MCSEAQMASIAVTCDTVHYLPICWQEQSAVKPVQITARNVYLVVTFSKHAAPPSPQKSKFPNKTQNTRHDYLWEGDWRLCRKSSTGNTVCFVCIHQRQLSANPQVYLGTSHPSLLPESSVVHAWQYRIIYCYARREEQVALGKLEKHCQSQCCPFKHASSCSASTCRGFIFLLC